MSTPVKAFSLAEMDHGPAKGRPRINRKKSITVYLSEKGTDALASIEGAYRRAGVAAFSSRHDLIERLLVEHVEKARDLEDNIKKYCFDK